MFFLVVLMTLYFLLKESVSISVLVSLENWVSLALSPWLHKVHPGVSEISSVSTGSCRLVGDAKRSTLGLPNRVVSNANWCSCKVQSTDDEVCLDMESAHWLDFPAR